MAAAPEPLLMTVAQFRSRPENGAVFEELHWGELVSMSRPKPWHVKLQMLLAELLRPLLSDNGYVVTELPFRAVPEYDLRAADVAFVSRRRWDQVAEQDLCGAPELVIEIVSPSNSRAQLREYAALCLANGCGEFWIIDRESRSVTVTQSTGESICYSAEQLVPVFGGTHGELSVARIFA
jgi:Uma2 family endonuclease